MITTCTNCGKLYEAGSEEQANEPTRWCQRCLTIKRLQGLVVALQKVDFEALAQEFARRQRPRCQSCDLPALDGKLTCGKAECGV